MLIRDINGEFAGVCRYCGQIITFIDKQKEDIDADEAATRRCGCPEAVAYRMELEEIEARKNAYRDAMAAVNELFSEGEKPINSEAQLVLHQLVKLICDGWVDKADVAADGITAKLQITSKGNVKITRKEKRSAQGRCRYDGRGISAAAHAQARAERAPRRRRCMACTENHNAAAGRYREVHFDRRYEHRGRRGGHAGLQGKACECSLPCEKGGGQMRTRRYEVLTIEAGVEKVQLDTTSFEAARAAYRDMKEFNRGRIRINGGRILRIHEADKLMFGRKGWVLGGSDEKKTKPRSFD